jgi:hypothetical protein
VVQIALGPPGNNKVFEKGAAQGMDWIIVRLPDSQQVAKPTYIVKKQLETFANLRLDRLFVNALINIAGGVQSKGTHRQPGLGLKTRSKPKPVGIS